MPDFSTVLRVSALILLSCVVPIGIFVGRQNIRASRRDIVRDLVFRRNHKIHHKIFCRMV